MKLLIVDDHPVVRSGLRRLVAVEPQTEVEEAANGREALTVFKAFRPDVVLLDLNLPSTSGFEVIGRLRIEDSKVRILVFSVHDSPMYAARAIQAGAKGYVSKNAPPDQILDALNRVVAGLTYIEPEIAQELALWNLRESPYPLQDLSPRDLEILRLLGEGNSLPQIAEALGASYKTVANHSTQLKAKLGVSRTADLIRIAISYGISSVHVGLSVNRQS